MPSRRSSMQQAIKQLIMPLGLVVSMLLFIDAVALGGGSREHKVHVIISYTTFWSLWLLLFAIQRSRELCGTGTRGSRVDADGLGPIASCCGRMRYGQWRWIGLQCLRCGFALSLCALLAHLLSTNQWLELQSTWEAVPEQPGVREDQTQPAGVREQP